MDNKSSSPNIISHMKILPKINVIKASKSPHSLSPTFKINNRLIGNIIFPSNSEIEFNSNYIESLKKKAKEKAKKLSHKYNEIHRLAILLNPIDSHIVVDNQKKNKRESINTKRVLQRKPSLSDMIIEKSNCYQAYSERLSPQKYNLKNSDNSFENKDKYQSVQIDESENISNMNDKKRIEIFDRLRRDSYKNKTPIISLKKLNLYRANNIDNMLNISKVIDKTELIRKIKEKQSQLNTQELYSYNHEEWRKRNSSKLNENMNKKKILKEFGFSKDSTKQLHAIKGKSSNLDNMSNESIHKHKMIKAQSVASIFNNMQKQTEKIASLAVESEKYYNEINSRKHYYINLSKRESTKELTFKDEIH